MCISCQPTSVLYLLIKSATRFCEASCCTYVANEARTEIRGKTACVYGWDGMGLPERTRFSGFWGIATFPPQPRDEDKPPGFDRGLRKKKNSPLNPTAPAKAEKSRRQ